MRLGGSGGIGIVKSGRNAARQALLKVHRVGGIRRHRLPHLRKFPIRHIGKIFVVGHNQAVGQRHHLAVHILRRLLQRHIVAQGFAHLLHAVRAGQNGHQKTLLRRLPHHPLQLPPHQQVEHLVGAAKLHIRLNRHRIVSLQQRVEQLRNGDGPVPRVAVGEIVPVQKLVDRKAAGEFNHIGQGKIAEPLALPFHLGAAAVHNLEKLAHIGFGVFQHLGVGKHCPGGGAPGGVSDLRRPVPHNEDDLMPQFL